MLFVFLGRLVRDLWREAFPKKPVAIPGKYPWSVPAGNHPPYGTVFFEDARQKHIADGLGGMVSISKGKLAKKPRPHQARGTRPF